MQDRDEKGPEIKRRGQLLDIWLPRWLLNRSVSAGNLQKIVGWLRRPARFVDRWSGPRECHANHGSHPIQCESGRRRDHALGPSLLAEDGLIAIISIALSAGAVVLVVMALL